MRPFTMICILKMILIFCSGALAAEDKSTSIQLRVNATVCAAKMAMKRIERTLGVSFSEREFAQNSEIAKKHARSSYNLNIPSCYFVPRESSQRSTEICLFTPLAHGNLTQSNSSPFLNNLNEAMIFFSSTSKQVPMNSYKLPSSLNNKILSVLTLSNAMIVRAEGRENIYHSKNDIFPGLYFIKNLTFAENRPDFAPRELIEESIDSPAKIISYSFFNKSLYHRIATNKGIHSGRLKPGDIESALEEMPPYFPSTQILNHIPGAFNIIDPVLPTAVEEDLLSYQNCLILN